MLASLPCTTTVCRVHAYVGFGIVGGWAVMLLWGIVALIAKRVPTTWFWRLLAVLQGLLIIQVVAGVVLLAAGHRQQTLHYLYGSVFPAIVLVIAHVLGRGMEDERDTVKVFTAAAFFLFGLTLRALATGLGLP
ncbi:MAG TPA: hypothetical protein VF972_10595 [Actinomycetota bacterium]